MNEQFKGQLDKLIVLFQKFRNKIANDEIPGFDKNMLTSMDMVINNYNMIKNSISDEMLGQFSGPIQMMMNMMITQLKDELGEDIAILPSDTPEQKEMKRDLGEIDSLLKNSKNLSMNDIDALLDERAKLKPNEGNS